MQNKLNRSKVIINGTVWYLSNNSGYYVSGFSIYNETKDSVTIEELIHTLNKLGLASTYYEDYGCSDRNEFVDLLNKKADAWRKSVEELLKKLSPAPRFLSHQLALNLRLAEQKGKYQYPSSYLIDSS
jgi:hypothetical protein